MIGVVVPAHNEADCLEACLTSVLHAATHRDLHGEPVRVMVVLDGCTDASRHIASRFAVTSLISEACNVGRARALGADHLLASQARWLAFTDADTVVADSWLVDQLALACDAVCGTVTVDDWAQYSPAVRQQYEAQYTNADGHRHIHGANFGVSALAYRRAGGFAPLCAHEDVALVRALESSGASIAWSAKPGVRTSARLEGRAPEGFAGYLRDLQIQVLGAAQRVDHAQPFMPGTLLTVAPGGSEAC